MKIPRCCSITAGLLAVSMLPLAQSGCSKEAAPAPTAAATPAPAATASAPAVAATPDPNASVTLTTNAWNALNAKTYDQAVTFAQKCIDLYRSQALDQAKGMTAPLTVKEEIQAKWALNDVGTCYYIMGQAYEKSNKTKEAVAAYQTLANDLPYTQCWDPKGWFWPPAKAAKDRIKALQLDTLN
jgi:hypothetical protein